MRLSEKFLRRDERGTDLKRVICGELEVGMGLRSCGDL
jgi:hypothetical protein